jgi:hypothetical protein
MDQPGNNHLLLRPSQAPPTAYNGSGSYNTRNGSACGTQNGHNGSLAYNGQPAAADRMRELLARTVHDHIVEERSVASALQEIRMRLETMDCRGLIGPGATVDGLAATMDGLAATIGALDSKLTARLERLDERLDDQYDRVRSVEDKLEGQTAYTEDAVTRAVEAATAGITTRIASLEDAVLTLAEALLRPASRMSRPPQVPPHDSAVTNGRSVLRP